MTDLARTSTRLWRMVREDGGRSVARRVARVAYQRSGADALEFPLLPGDVWDSGNPPLPVPEKAPSEGTPLRVGWVTTPPHPRSGGHTTLFRMVEGVERAGHTCVIYLYDRFQGDSQRHIDSIRTAWPQVQAEVRVVDDRLDDLDACFATSWPTAHVLARRSQSVACRRLYLVQDFEPYFYPRGSEYALAEDTYRFGFRAVTIGRMVAEQIALSAGVESDVAEFGCDTGVYGLTNTGRRNGVAFYTKPSVSRRGFALASLALEELHHRHPEVEIHTFGVDHVSVPFPVTAHGTLPPAELSQLFNQCVTGLAMSFTNISLIAEELLACGTIPVVNDSPMARADLVNPNVLWARPTPMGLADALSQAIEAADVPGAAAAAAASARRGWSDAQSSVVAALERTVYRPAEATS